MSKNANSKNRTQNTYNSTNETDRTTSKNYAGKSGYDKNCHNDAYDEDEME